MNNNETATIKIENTDSFKKIQREKIFFKSVLFFLLFVVAYLVFKDFSHVYPVYTFIQSPKSFSEEEFSQISSVLENQKISLEKHYILNIFPQFNNDIHLVIKEFDFLQDIVREGKNLNLENKKDEYKNQNFTFSYTFVKKAIDGYVQNFFLEVQKHNAQKQVKDYIFSNFDNQDKSLVVLVLNSKTYDFIGEKPIKILQYVKDSQYSWSKSKSFDPKECLDCFNVSSEFISKYGLENDLPFSWTPNMGDFSNFVKKIGSYNYIVVSDIYEESLDILLKNDVIDKTIFTKIAEGIEKKLIIKNNIQNTDDIFSQSDKTVFFLPTRTCLNNSLCKDKTKISYQFNTDIVDGIYFHTVWVDYENLSDSTIEMLEKYYLSSDAEMDTFGIQDKDKTLKIPEKYDFYNESGKKVFLDKLELAAGESKVLVIRFKQKMTENFRFMSLLGESNNMYFQFNSQKSFVANSATGMYTEDKTAYYFLEKLSSPIFLNIRYIE